MTLTAESLREALAYNPETGVFVWRISPSTRTPAGAVAGCLKSDGYITITFRRRSYKAHRLAWLYAYGRWPTHIDHIDRDKTNNRLRNLREATRSANAFNRGLFRNNKSGVAGVFWYEKLRKWQANLTLNGVVLYLGRFDEFQAAVSARRAAEKFYKVDMGVTMKEVATT